MSRSGYVDDCSGWDLVRWRGAVTSGLSGRRGQAFLREMLAAMDAMPVKRLIRHDLVCPEGVCAMGTVAIQRRLDVSKVDPEQRESVAKLFGLSEAMVAEVSYANDEYWRAETPEQRFGRMRTWILKWLREDA